MPSALLFSFAKLIEFYRTDMVNDDEEVARFMRSASVKEILSNKGLWDTDLSWLESEVARYVDQ